MNAKTKATAAPAVPEFKYVLISGKHNVVLSDGSRQELLAGDEIMMTEAQAALFQNKFRRAVIEDPGTEAAVAPKVEEAAAPAAPTYEQLDAAIAALPVCLDDPESVYDDANEAITDFMNTFGELMHDGHFEAMQKKFADAEQLQEAAAPKKK